MEQALTPEFSPKILQTRFSVGSNNKCIFLVLKTRRTSIKLNYMPTGYKLLTRQVEKLKFGLIHIQEKNALFA